MPDSAQLTSRGWIRSRGGDSSRYSLWHKETQRIILDSETGNTLVPETLSGESAYLFQLEALDLLRDLFEVARVVMDPNLQQVFESRLQTFPRPQRRIDP